MYIIMSFRIVIYSRDIFIIIIVRMIFVFLIMLMFLMGVKMDVYDCNWLLKGMLIILKDFFVL